MPSKIKLSLNNPACNRVSFDIFLKSTGLYSLAVYNIMGQKLWSYHANKTKTGNHTVKWNFNANGNNSIGNGIYFGILKWVEMKFVKALVWYVKSKGA